MRGQYRRIALPCYVPDTLQPETRDRLLNISARFYERHGDSFHSTRNHPWPGWDQLWKLTQAQLPGRIRCLDAGCGNGRFARFLRDQTDSMSYLGVDLDEGLLAAARRDMADLESADLVRRDLVRDGLRDAVPADSQHLVTLFGVLHHVPDEDARRDLLRQLAKRVAPGGILVASIWRLDQDPDRFSRKEIPWPEWNDAQAPDDRIDPVDLDEGDALLSWRGDRATPRYCHFPPEAEIERLADLGSDLCFDLSLEERFEADGPTGRDNLYLVWKRCAAC